MSSHGSRLLLPKNIRTLRSHTSSAIVSWFGLPFSDWRTCYLQRGWSVSSSFPTLPVSQATQNRHTMRVPSQSEEINSDPKMENYSHTSATMHRKPACFLRKRTRKYRCWSPSCPAHCTTPHLAACGKANSFSSSTVQCVELPSATPSTCSRQIFQASACDAAHTSHNPCALFFTFPFKSSLKYFWSWPCVTPSFHSKLFRSLFFLVPAFFDAPRSALYINNPVLPPNSTKKRDSGTARSSPIRPNACSTCFRRCSLCPRKLADHILHE